MKKFIVSKSDRMYSDATACEVYPPFSFRPEDMHKAARHGASLDRSDPFTYSRLMSRMREGYLSPDDILLSKSGVDH